MQEVADEAKVSMATLYRHVAGKEGLLLGVMMAEADKMVARLQDMAALGTDPADALVDGVLLTVSEARNNEILMAVLSPDSFGLTLSAPGALESAVAQAKRFVEPILASAPRSRRRPDVTADEAAEWVVRIVQSMIQMPDVQSRDETAWRSYLRRLLVPALLRR